MNVKDKSDRGEPHDTSALEETLGYRFKSGKLLTAALTHPSYRSDKKLDFDNQRLEFLGDAILGFLLAETMFVRFNGVDEGTLTVLRSSVASGVNLAEKAALINAGEFLLLGNGEKKNGGGLRKSNLADAMEAIIAAVYLDGGMDAARDVFHRLFDSDMDKLKSNIWDNNPKGLAQHIAETFFKTRVSYEFSVRASEPSGADEEFRVRAVITGTDYAGDGVGHNKKEASVDAARDLIKKLPEELIETV